MTYDESIAFLESFSNLEHIHLRRNINTFGLERIKHLLKDLGNPQKHFHIIHVAGSKGKGSTAKMIADIYYKSGYKTGLYSSPHLYDMRERILINNRMIAKSFVASFMTKLNKILNQSAFFDNNSPTYFEIITAMAYDYFYTAGVHCAVIETGLGGRLDATNVASPLACVITAIGYEHTALLGRNITDIAREKSMIIKRNTTCILARQNKKVVYDIIRARCRQVRAKMIDAGGDYRKLGGKPRVASESFCFRRKNGWSDVYKLALLGEHQIDNAITAIHTAWVLQKILPVKEDIIKKALCSVKWPGRFELVSKTPKIIFDIAHNTESFNALKKTLSAHYPHAQVTFIISLMKDKDARRIAKNFEQKDRVIVTRTLQERSENPAKLAKKIGSTHRDVIEKKSPQAALRYALKHTRSNGVIVAAGSSYLLQELREALTAESVDLTQSW